MIIERIPQIMKLSPEERAELFCELSEVISKESLGGDPDVSLVSELNRRWESYLRDAKTAAPWSVVRERIFRPAAK